MSDLPVAMIMSAITNVVVFLLQDLHYMAKDKGETALAEVCIRNADAIDAANLAASVPGFDDESVTEESSGSDEDSYSSEEEYANMIAATAQRQAARIGLGQPQRPQHKVQPVSNNIQSCCSIVLV